MTNVCKNTQGNTPIKIYVLHGYTDGLTDPIVSTDYEEVYAAMKAAYESALDGVEQEDSDREYSFLHGLVCYRCRSWRLDGMAGCGIGVTSPQRTACIPGLRFLSYPTENPLCILSRQYGKIDSLRIRRSDFL